MKVLETDRLLLRRFAEADVENLVRLDSDPRVMRFLAGEPTPRAEIEQKVLPEILGDYERGPAGRWAAVEKTTGEFIGWISLQPPEDGSTAELELGYRLLAKAWGRGYATEGARAAIHKGFTELGTRRVWAQTMAVNTPSRRVLARSGLTYLRTFHLHFDDPLPGTEHGEVEYELTRDQWAARTRSR
ncbi:GNAT family N-acetyltransferase [Amycolatopsis rubida]|uniref:Protein N-acetyltransferase, RimJ/RimL family n=1 Tax=Amycolatopsis rubida TaxID=112413 RepID=A0A1I5ITC9_9PSEU|nr:GNAT family N-acetyltransferase [Amycolatopsis rubida]SFO63421.1 Protein N-acetyltransferase, RimJ/RimL family [Amycolatopsis rubida]